MVMDTPKEKQHTYERVLQFVRIRERAQLRNAAKLTYTSQNMDSSAASFPLNTNLPHATVTACSMWAMFLCGPLKIVRTCTAVLAWRPNNKSENEKQSTKYTVIKPITRLLDWTLSDTMNNIVTMVITLLIIQTLLILIK